MSHHRGSPLLRRRLQFRGGILHSTLISYPVFTTSILYVFSPSLAKVSEVKKEKKPREKKMKPKEKRKVRAALVAPKRRWIMHITVFAVPETARGAGAVQQREAGARTTTSGWRTLTTGENWATASRGNGSAASARTRSWHSDASDETRSSWRFACTF